MIGQTITHYKILDKLGEGGMGVVYKAEDTKLKRSVALKFLPKGLEVHEPERARFLQEAQAASALNHPNVCTIHAIEEYGGISNAEAATGKQQFIVMEFVDGRTLRDLKPETLKIETLLSYAIQIGEALQEAHSHGIVHRDVKPENIMVNTKNQIKVMDFGLAKLKGSLKLTRTSSTVGTLAYMAPEQIQGGEVDARSDLFSFGIVLFEMLTGRLPFRGEHEAAMMYSIVNEEPEPIERLKPDVSPLLANIIQRALEKDSNDRYQSAGDMVIELRRLHKKSAKVTRASVVEMPAVTLGQVVPEASIVGKAVREKPSKRIFWAGIGIVALLGIIAALYLLLPRQQSRRTINPDMTFRVLPIPFTQVGYPGLSRDGDWAAFPASDASGKWDIYFMNTTSGESRRITSDSSLYMNITDISPDGSRIVYDRSNAPATLPEIAIVSSVGGSSKRVVDNAAMPRWRPDGQRVGYVRWKGYGSESGKAEFWTMRPDGSDNRRELIDSLSNKEGAFSWSPDGRSICWIRRLSEQCQEAMLYDLSTGKARQLTFDRKRISDVCWTSNDEIVYASNKSGNFNLWMVPASGGSALQITRGAGPDYSMAVSRDGSKLLYYQAQNIAHIWIAGTDGSNLHQITFDDAVLWAVSFSPDGKEVLFARGQPVGSKEGAFVGVIDRDGRNRRQLTSGEESINNPFQSPDGRWIMYGRHSLSDPIDSSRVYLIDARNPGTPKLVAKGWPVQWIDEKTFTSYDYAAQGMWLNRIDGGESRKFYEDSTWAMSLQGGKYIGYYNLRSGLEGVWISAAPGVKDPALPSPRRLAYSGLNGTFDKSGKFLYWVKNAGELRRIPIPSGKEEIIQRTFPGLNPSFDCFYDISYDGKEIVYTDSHTDSKLIMIENLFK